MHMLWSYSPAVNLPNRITNPPKILQITVNSNTNHGTYSPLPTRAAGRVPTHIRMSVVTVKIPQFYQGRILGLMVTNQPQSSFALERSATTCCRSTICQLFQVTTRQTLERYGRLKLLASWSIYIQVQVQVQTHVRRDNNYNKTTIKLAIKLTIKLGKT